MREVKAVKHLNDHAVDSWFEEKRELNNILSRYESEITLLVRTAL